MHDLTCLPFDWFALSNWFEDTWHIEHAYIYMCNYVFFFIIFILVILLFKISDIDMVILFREY